MLNFAAGPSALPLSVLKKVQEELLNWHGTGVSIMEYVEHVSVHSSDATSSACVYRRFGMLDMLLEGGILTREILLFFVFVVLALRIGHRSSDFAKIIGEAESDLRTLLYVPLSVV